MRIRDRLALWLSSKDLQHDFEMGLWPFTSQRTSSGARVNPDISMQVATVNACVRIIAENIASMPLYIYRWKANGGRFRDRAHPLYNVLNYSPNQQQTRFEFVEMMLGHILLRGNFYALKILDQGGNIRSLFPLHPDRVTPKREADLSITYEVRMEKGQVLQFPAANMFHVRDLSFDGLKGDSRISQIAESVGTSLQAEEFQARFFSNDATPGGVLEHPAALGEKAFKNLEQQINSKFRGASNSHKFLILQEGMKWQQMGVTAKDAEFLGLRKFNKGEIASIFRVPPHMIGDTERSTSWGTGIEQQSIGFLVYTLLPWQVRIEQAIMRDLLTEQDRQFNFVEFLPTSLLRGDVKSRFDSYAVGRQWGWLSINDIRRMENMDPIGVKGDEYISPLNMAPVGSTPTQPAPGDNSTDGGQA